MRQLVRDELLAFRGVRVELSRREEDVVADGHCVGAVTAGDLLGALAGVDSHALEIALEKTLHSVERERIEPAGLVEGVLRLLRRRRGRGGSLCGPQDSRTEVLERPKIGSALNLLEQVFSLVLCG